MTTFDLELSEAHFPKHELYECCFCEASVLQIQTEIAADVAGSLGEA